MFAIGQTKFEGLPDLPEDVEWPKNEHGCLRFLAQINLSELAGTVALQSLPIQAGILSFFAMCGENEPSGEISDNSCVVLYHGPDASLVRRPLPSSISEECESGPAVKLVLTETWDLPGSDSLETEKLQSVNGGVLDYEVSEKICEARQELHPYSNHLFGYPLDSQSLVDPSPEDFSNILTLTSSSKTRWSWGDDDRLNISVSFDKIDESGKSHPACGVVG